MFIARYLYNVVPILELTSSNRKLVGRKTEESGKQSVLNFHFQNLKHEDLKRKSMK